MFERAPVQSAEQLKRRIQIARGESPADLVIKNTCYLDVFTGEWCRGDVAIADGVIVGTQQDYSGKQEIDGRDAFVVPGFIDSHVHIESSMMTPSRFQEMVLPRGTTTAIWDPHEIANVRGTEGIQWALDASDHLDLDVFVMVPSCVPSTSPEMRLETSGAFIDATRTMRFQSHPRVLGLAEMMNYPGVLFGNDEVLDKLVGFQDFKRDGHAPGLSGKDLNAYLTAGIHTCHESTRPEEAREKMQKGLHVLIREGSCAKDGDALLPLLNDYSSAVLGLCSDDRNPADILEEGHLNYLMNKALQQGHHPANIFRAASWAAARMFGLEDRGAVAPGFKADIVLVKPQSDGQWKSGFTVVKVIKQGQPVDAAVLRKFAENAGAKGYQTGVKNLHLRAIEEDDFRISSRRPQTSAVRVIRINSGAIVTGSEVAQLQVRDESIQPDLNADVLKIAVFERHHGSGHKGVAFVSGFGLKSGAIATSINHDSHNVIVVGANDAAMVRAVNRLREIDGGIVVTDGHQDEVLPLPIGGLMSVEAPEWIAERLLRLKQMTAALGCRLPEPFLGLSFLALPVIPHLKITDRGLVDVDRMTLVPVEWDGV